MVDFGVMFDAAKADAETKIQEYSDSARQSQERADSQFAEIMKPLNVAVRPVLEQAQRELASRGVEVKIDFADEYNAEGGMRVPAIHFGMMWNGIFSKVYIFELRDKLFTCSSDEGNKLPHGKRGGVFATAANNISSSMVGDVVKRAMLDITQKMEHDAFLKAYPNAKIYNRA